MPKLVPANYEVFAAVLQVVKDGASDIRAVGAQWRIYDSADSEFARGDLPVCSLPTGVLTGPGETRGSFRQRALSI